MSEIKFCPQCGEKRVENARFCAGCGSPFTNVTTNRDPRLLIYSIAAVLSLSLVISFAVKWLVVDKTARSNHAPVAASTESDHVHTEPARLGELKELAASGEPAALMDLAEYQLLLSQDDSDFLFQASHTLDRFLEGYPEHAYALRLLGNVYYNLKVPDKAAQYFGKYLEQRPRDANVRANLATQLLVLEKPREAISAYNKALEGFPDFYSAHYNIALAYQKIGDGKLAEAHRKRAAEIDREHGKIGPPDLSLPRLPDGIEPTPETSLADSESTGKYQPLEAFFKNHQVIGPKMTSFQVEEGTAILYVDSFPMNAMPASMRESFDKKIKDQLVGLGEGTALQIRDAQNRAVLATYQN